MLEQSHKRVNSILTKYSSNKLYQPVVQGDESENHKNRIYIQSTYFDEWIKYMSWY